MLRLPSKQGFGIQPNLALPSPYAEALFGCGLDLMLRSKMTMALMKKDVMEMSQNTRIINDPDFKFACLCAFDAFKFRNKVIPYHLNDVFFLDLPIRTSSPGLPWQPDYKTKGEVMDCSLARNSIRWYWHAVKRGDEMIPSDTKVLYRSHLTDDAPKIRAVYGYPVTMTLGEAQFALPLIEEFKKGQTPIAYGFDMVTGGAMRLRRALLKFKHYNCIDFKRFDKTVSKQLIEIAFNILEQNIDFTSYRDHGIPDARRLYRAWNHCIDYFINTIIRLPNGDRFKKSAGIPSGSYFTQIVGSIVNYICLVYACVKITGKVPLYIKVFGDDSVFATDVGIDVFDFYREVYKLGMEINLKKTVITADVDKVDFLGFCIAGGFPQRSTRKWMSALFYPEYPDKTFADFQSRALGLLYANHGVNPDFDKIARCIIGVSPFSVCLSRDFARYLRNIGIDPGGLSTLPPSRREFLFSLLG